MRVFLMAGALIAGIAGDTDRAAAQESEKAPIDGIEGTGNTHLDWVLNDATENVRLAYDDGYFYSMHIGIIDADGTASYYLPPVTRESRVQVSGGCDTDCSDMDLFVYSGEGDDPIDSDVMDDAIPMVWFTAMPGVRYRIDSTMPGCATRQCFYSITASVEE